MAKRSPSSPYVSRAGLKLEAALRAFAVDVTDKTCADLGSHVGGFVDCLLRHGARRVYSVDTSYGTLAWSLRKDARVIVLERTNALHVQLPERVDLVTIDCGWTRQEKLWPHVATLLRPDGDVITLIKPHYEADENLLEKGVLREEAFQEVVDRVLEGLRTSGRRVVGVLASPLLGHGGNRELLAHLRG